MELKEILANEDPALVAEVLASDPELSAWAADMESSGYFNFIARPDRPEDFDQQHSFVYNRDPVSFLVGGNAAGTTEAAAAKAANFMLRDQMPPRCNTPFWVIGNTYDQVCDVCWSEKLLGHGHIPSCEIEWDRISWLNKKTGRPSVVPLKPWPGSYKHRNWSIHFKSYEQGRTALQAASIGGFWFSEQFPLDLFLETLRGCRDYMFAGGQFAEFTPIDPDLCLWVEKVMDDPPPGWAFYRANTACNKENLAEGWFDQFFGTVPDEILETRLTGALATFEGTIYQKFNPLVHVVPESKVKLTTGMYHWMGTDWGASQEHPHVTIWAARDGLGNWIVYDEYFSVDQTAITMDHVSRIVEKSALHGWPMEEGRLNLSDQIFYRQNYADPSRPGEINEFNFRGIPTAPASNDVHKGINTVRSLLKSPPEGGPPKLLISERCEHLIEQMRKYRWLRGRRPSEGRFLNPAAPQAAPLKRDDDACDALRYLLFSVTRSEGAVPSSQSHRDYVKTHKHIQLRRSNEKRKDVTGNAGMRMRTRDGWFRS